ncbi:hypothetical protein AB0D63_23770 [Kitasatospora sp. NPDC048343]|uniref:hypothetical protein n=1 Tax=Kitasatospora sp. NPDC048343 TaxID=3154717 RepID=UPI0033C7ECB0
MDADGRLTGLLSSHDLLDALRREDEAIRSEALPLALTPGSGIVPRHFASAANAAASPWSAAPAPTATTPPSVSDSPASTASPPWPATSPGTLTTPTADRTAHRMPSGRRVLRRAQPAGTDQRWR